MRSQHHVDQMGHTIYPPQNPSRIISLVPSQTELLYHLELDDQVVGITKFCIHPPHWRNEKTIIGGTKKFNFEKIDALQPDLIIGNKEENYQEGIDRLKERYPVWMTDVNTLPTALQMVTDLGRITNRETQAINLAKEINNKFNTIERVGRPVRVLYFIWMEPWMVVGADTFINDMLIRIGLSNCASGLVRYPIVDEAAVADFNPELIFLSSEPYPFKAEHVQLLENQFPNTKVILVDGEYFSWYGSRLLYAPEYFKSLIDTITFE